MSKETDRATRDTIISQVASIRDHIEKYVPKIDDYDRAFYRGELIGYMFIYNGSAMKSEIGFSDTMEKFLDADRAEILVSLNILIAMLYDNENINNSNRGLGISI